MQSRPARPAGMLLLLLAHAAASAIATEAALTDLEVDLDDLGSVAPPVLTVLGKVMDRVSAMHEEMRSMRGEIGALRARLRSLESRSIDNVTRSRLLEGLDPWRRTQGAEPEPEPDSGIGQNVKIIKPAVVRCGGPGGTTADGEFDYTQCEEPAFAQCHRDACAGHTIGGKRRRGQAAQICKPADLEGRVAEINSRCCDEPDEDCSQGYPSVCNVDCAEIFLPFMAECQSALQGSTQFVQTAALCEANESPPSLAEQLNVQCVDGTGSGDCVPACSEEYHGFLMLLNIDGDDTKLSCERQHGFYSWLGAATDGGYLGSDFLAFFSAVVSGAAGVYVGRLTEDAGINTELIVHPEQVVSVTGESDSLARAPRWGVGGFTVQARGSLSLTSIALDSLATFIVSGGGTLSLASMAVSMMVLNGAEEHLTGVGSTLRVTDVTLSDSPSAALLMGTMTVADDGSKTTTPPDFGIVGPHFLVTAGPCVAYGGCVGRPQGYLPNEACAMTVVGASGTLGSCGIFDMEDVAYDAVELPARRYGGSDCPSRVTLQVGDTVQWHSDDRNQGSLGHRGMDNGCAAKGTCGAPYSGDNVGGGWQICFA